MRKKNMHNFFVGISASVILPLMLTGCANAELNNTITDHDINVTVEETNAETNLVDENGSGNTDTVTEESVVVEDDKSYIFENLCKVSEDYEVNEAGVPVDVIVSNVKKESYGKMILLSHEIEEKEGKTIDNVSYKFETANPSGMVPQIVECIASFEEDGDSWTLVSNEWKEWTIKNFRLYGSDGIIALDDSVDLKSWFGEDLSKDDATLYLHIKKNLDILSCLKNDDMSVLEPKVGTKFNGSLFYVSGDVKKEVKYECWEGTTNDEGILTLKLETEFGDGNVVFDETYKAISNKTYKVATSDDFEAGENEVFVEELDTFEVTSESVVYDEYNKGCGKLNGNVSPELSWEEVDGANMYLIYMIDLDVHDAEYPIHWIDVVDGTHVDKGQFNEKSGYVGPYPPSPHEYTIFVFALKEEPGDLKLVVDMNGKKFEDMVELLEKDKPGNVISYGQLSATYEYVEKVW